MNELLNQAQELIKEKKYQAAHALCIRIINNDSENIKAIRLKNSIEELVEKKNIALIEKDLESLEPLWEEGKYEDILLRLQKLYQFAPHYDRIKKLIIKANELLEKQKIRKDENFISETAQEIKTLEKQKKFQEALLKENQLKPYLESHPQLRNAFLRTHRHYVKYLLKEKKEFLKSENYKEIIEFLRELQKIDPFYWKIARLIKKFQGRYYSEESLQKKEYIFQGLENIKTLYQKEKYDKAIKAAKEILQIEKNNKQAAAFLKKSLHYQEAIMNKEITQQIISQFQANYPEYLKNRTNFIHLSG